MTPGQIKEQQLRDGGFNDDAVNQWRGKTAQQLSDGGYNPQQVRDYFGTKEPDMSGAAAAVKENLKQHTMADGSPKPVQDIWGAMEAGWQGSFSGLFSRGKMPDVVPSGNESIVQSFAESAAGLVGDIPAMAAGMVSGGAAGTSIAPGLGTALGASAGAFSVPAAMRRVLIDHYQKGDLQDAGDFARRVVDTTWEGTKGALVGVASEFTGGLAGAFGGTAAKLAAEVATQTTVSKGLEGELPNRDDFIHGAVAIVGLHGLTYAGGKLAPISEKLMNIYKESGVKPNEVAEAIDKDPHLKGEVLAENPDLPKGTSPNLPEVKEPSGTLESEPKITPEHEQTQSESDKAQEEILARQGEQTKEEKAPLLERLRDNFDAEYAKHMDKTILIKNVMDEMGKTEITPENAHVLARLHGAVEDKVTQFMEVNTRDFRTGEVNGEGLKPLIDEYKKATGDESLDKLKAYGIAARTLELGGRGIEQLGTDQHSDAQSPDRVFLNANKEIQPYFDRLVEWKNRSLDYVVDSGRYSQELGEMLKDKNKRYFSFKKIVEADELTGKPPTSAKGIKAIGDSSLKLKDPFQSMIEDTGTMIRMAQETHTTNTFVESILLHQNELAISNLEAKLDGPQIEGAPGEAPKAMDPILRKAEKQKGPLGSNQIAYYLDGERTVYDTRPEIAEVIKSLAGNKPAADLWTTMLKPFATMLRYGTVDNPLFALRHSWRNQLTAVTLSKTGMIPGEALGNAKEFAAKGDLVNQFMYDGGGVNRVVGKLGKGYLDGEIYRLNDKAPFLDKAWNKIKTLGEFSHMAIVANDNLLRFTEYKKTLAQGGSRTEAAFNAREVLPDFQKAGLQQSALQSVTAFMKVHMLGQARMAQEVGSNPLGYIAKNLAAITVPSLLLAAAQSGDDAVDDLPSWQKYNYWPVHIPDWKPANNLGEAMQIKNAYPSQARQKADGSWEINRGTIYRIQKPFTNGIFFGSAAEVALDAWKKGNPEKFGAFLKTIAGSTIAEPIPTGLAPMAEQMVNKNFYTDNPIVRQGMENKLPEMQYDAYTSQTARTLGKLLSYVPLARDIGPKDAKLDSPMVIDNYLKGWGGTLGQYAVDAMDKALRASGVAPKDVGPVGTLADTPFVREFVIRYPNGHPQSVVDFQERFQKTDAVHNSIQQMIKEGNVKGALDLQDRYAMNMDRLKGIDTAVKNTNATIQKLIRLPDVDPVQKRQLIDTMMYQMTSAAKMGNKIMDEFEKHAKTKAGSN